MNISRTQVRELPTGFTPTGNVNRKQRRSKEYQKMVQQFYKEQAIAQAKDLTNDSTNTTTE